jgi:thiosulfate/3-mercaptopyruvate sulfurtransferase
MSDFARPELLASTEWLAENVRRPGVRVIDVRWRPDGTARQLFAVSHIPGAAYLDWTTELVSEDEAGELFLLAGPDEIAATLARAGVRDGSTLVVYDDTLSMYAARAWWSLRAYGLDAVRILDGGFPAWVAEGRPTSSGAGATRGGSVHPRGQLRMRLTASDLRPLLNRADVSLLDARSPTEYRGLEGNTRRLGHIPGAINVPVAATHEPGAQRFRNADAIAQQLRRANVGHGRRLICYDGSGVQATKLAFVLTLLGFEDVSVYDGGWAEWGNRLDLPVER